MEAAAQKEKKKKKKSLAIHSVAIAQSEVQMLWQQKGANYRYGSAASRDANVKLFITLGSPYARMARITVQF